MTESDADIMDPESRLDIGKFRAQLHPVWVQSRANWPWEPYLIEVGAVLGFNGYRTVHIKTRINLDRIDYSFLLDCGNLTLTARVTHFRREAMNGFYLPFPLMGTENQHQRWHGYHGWVERSQ